MTKGTSIIGASEAARIIARYLTRHNRHVVLVDNNKKNIEQANAMGLEAFQANLYNEDLNEHFELVDMGYLVAMTGSADIDNYAIKKYEKVFGENGTYRLLTSEELKRKKKDLPRQGIFSYKDDFINICEVVRDYPEMHEIDVQHETR